MGPAWNWSVSVSFRQAFCFVLFAIRFLFGVSVSHAPCTCVRESFWVPLRVGIVSIVRFVCFV